MSDLLKDLKCGLTIEEALNWCEQFTDNLVMANVDTKRRTLGLQAMKVCKSALEKQIPKKPIEDGYYDEPSVCPNCGCSVINEADNDYKFEYCYNCGQALDWSDTE